jgi:chemotaxis protein CheX
MAIYKQPESMYDGKHMDVVLINALLHSMYNIFRTMLGCEISAGIPALKEDEAARGTVSGVIGMIADGVRGSVALTLTPSTVRTISLRLLGKEIDDENQDHEAMDLAGELTNMLVGGAKRTLEEKGLDFDMQTPKLLEGQGHAIVHPSCGRTVLLPMSVGADEDQFYIELNFA